MNTFDCIYSRRSTRRYKQVPVELEKVQKVIEAGRFAPSGGNNQSAHFFAILKKDVIQKLYLTI